MEIKASFAHATKDLRTMGSKGLTALVRKQMFLLLNVEPEDINEVIIVTIMEQTVTFFPQH